MWLLRSGDTVVAKTDPPLISIVAWLAARLRRARLVNWLQDVFPEVATALGANPLPAPINALVLRLRDAALRAASMNVVIGEGMRERLAARGVPQSKLLVIENWAIEVLEKPLATDESQLRRSLGPGVRFVVGYSGNFGRAHEFETLVGAASLLTNREGLWFLFVGDGARLAELREGLRSRGVANATFLPQQPRERLADALAAADVHLVSLRPGLEGLIVPSKIYGIMAAARPILYVGDARGATARWLRACDIGEAVDVGDAQALAARITAFMANPEAARRAGMRARDQLEAHYRADIAGQLWLELLAGIPTRAADGPDALRRQPRP
jgi:glycosyltransferase involved in cell wall biosynthesis